MSHPDPSVPLPVKALREFEKTTGSDWGEAGVPLAELLRRVNRVAALIPEDDGRDSRVSRSFSPRSFRHYQTLGCIDPPKKEGNRALYGFRHFVQAQLVRRLLRERMPSAQIVALIAGRGTDEIRRMFLEGIDIVARADGDRGDAAALGMAETWRRVRVAQGVELHLCDGLPRLGPAGLRRLLDRLEGVLKKHRR